MLKASTAVLFKLPDNYIRQENGGEDNRSFTRYTGEAITIKDDEDGKLAEIMSANKKSGEAKLAVGKENINKYLTDASLKIVARDDIDTYVLKYGYGDKTWHLDYQINKNDIAVYRMGDKKLKVVSSHNITSIDRYEGRSLVETANVTSLGNGVYVSDEFSKNIENTGSGWLTNRYYVVHYDDGQTEKFYWEK